MYVNQFIIHRSLKATSLRNLGHFTGINKFYCPKRIFIIFLTCSFSSVSQIKQLFIIITYNKMSITVRYTQQIRNGSSTWGALCGNTP
jgi:hypothetical protein